MAPDDAPPSRRDFERLRHAIESIPDKMAELYVRADNYARDQKIHDITHGEQRKDIDGLQNIVKAVIGFVFATIGGALMALILTR